MCVFGSNIVRLWCGLVVSVVREKECYCLLYVTFPAINDAKKERKQTARLVSFQKGINVWNLKNDDSKVAVVVV